MTELQELKVQYADAYRKLNLLNADLQNLQNFIIETENKIKELESKKEKGDGKK